MIAASRASIVTGMYERTHGYTFQQGPSALLFNWGSYSARIIIPQVVSMAPCNPESGIYLPLYR